MTVVDLPFTLGGRLIFSQGEAANDRLLEFDAVALDGCGGERDLSESELEHMAIRLPKLSLIGESGTAITHLARNSRGFTVRQLIESIELTERLTRDQSQWLGSFDLHHCFFEGLSHVQEHTWELCWGS